MLQDDLNGAQSRYRPIEPAKVHIPAISRVGNPAMGIAESEFHPVEDIGSCTTMIKDVSAIRLILLSISEI